MNLQNIRNNAQLREQLASEYVLGTLRGHARRRFEGWLRDDAALRISVAECQDRLHRMAEFAPDGKPSPQVWRAIENRLGLQSGRSRWRGLPQSLRFWRGLGLASTALAAILVALLLTRPPEQVSTSAVYVATLLDNKAQPAVVIRADAGRHQLIVKVLASGNIERDKSLELWALPKEGSPRALGLIAANGIAILPLPEQLTPQSVPALAVSLEPKGGSPNPNAPTGPILFKGAWVDI